jgi:hypothetical protein
MPLDGHRGHGGVAGWRVGFPATAIIGGARRAEIDMRDIRSYPKLGRLVVRPFAFAFSTGHRHHHFTGLGLACSSSTHVYVVDDLDPSAPVPTSHALPRKNAPAALAHVRQSIAENLLQSRARCHIATTSISWFWHPRLQKLAALPPYPLVLVPSPYTSPSYWFWYLCCYIYHGRCPGRQHALGPSSGGAHGSGGHPATGVPRGSRRNVMSWRWVGKVARASSRPVHPVPLPCVRPPNPKPGAEHRAQAPAPAPASHRAQAKCRPSTSRLPIQAQLGGASVRTHGHDNDFLVGRLGRGRTVHSRPAVCPIIPCPRRVNRSLPMSFSRENDRS